MNRNIFTLLFVLILGSASMQAQSAAFGIKGGANFSNLTGSETDMQFITAYHFGGLVEVNLLDFISVQPELLYSLQGANMKAIDEKINLHYASLPLIFKIYFLEKLSLEVGPQFSVLISDNVENSKVNRTDSSFAAGLGFKLTEHLFIQGRYLFGLTEISKNSDTKNQLIQLSAGYKF
mgnify:FL=1